MSIMARMVGQTPWSAADAPVGPFALFRPRDEGVPRRPGGLPHNLGNTGGVAQ
jgi:hypothetical protein